MRTILYLFFKNSFLVVVTSIVVLVIFPLPEDSSLANVQIEKYTKLQDDANIWCTLCNKIVMVYYGCLGQLNQHAKDIDHLFKKRYNFQVSS